MADPRLVLVCSRSSGLGDLSRWGKALHARQQVVWPTTGSHTLRCLLTNGTFGSGVFAVEWSGRSIAMGHQPMRLPGGACQVADTLYGWPQSEVRAWIGVR